MMSTMLFVTVNKWTNLYEMVNVSHKIENARPTTLFDDSKTGTTRRKNYALDKVQAAMYHQTSFGVNHFVD